MKKIYNLFQRVGDKWKCPECGSKTISLAVDSLIGYWYPFCEECGYRGSEKELETHDRNLLFPTVDNR